MQFHLISYKFKTFLHDFITKWGWKNAYLAVTSEKITNYYQSNHPNNSNKLLSQKSSKQFLQTVITDIIRDNSSNYYQRNHSKQFLQTFITEVISNNAFKLLPEKSFQKMPIHHDKQYKLCLKSINRNLIFIL